MKTQRLTSLLLFSALPFTVFAVLADDRKIEDAAKASYNYRTVLEDSVKVKVKDGIVTLTGTVEDQDAKELAAETVRNLPGVTSVKNEIQIESTEEAGSDGWIAFKVRGSLLVKANVSVSSTEVEVKDGVVTLTGTAENAAQKELTEIYVKEIEGVKSVTNNIVVNPDMANRRASTAARGDRDAMIGGSDNRDARKSSESKDRVGGNAPIINTRDTTTPGQDTRDGAMARRDNRSDARDADRKNWTDQSNRDDREMIDDASITTQVKVALNRNKSTKTLDTQVTTKEGVVEITGYATSEAEKSLVSKLARDTRGVRSVNNDMTVAQR